MKELIAPLLVGALLAHGAAAASAADKPKATPSGADAERQAFLAYKLRETGQPAAKAAKLVAETRDAPAQLQSDIEKFNRDRKPLRTVAYGNTFGQGPGAASGN